MTPATYIAATRFGLGVGPVEASLTDARVMDWLWRQVQPGQANNDDFKGLPSAQDNSARLIIARKSGDKDAAQEVRKSFQQVFIDEMTARLHHAITTPTPFYERLVYFWSNHFTVSNQKGEVAGLAGAYEREAIRPYVTGRFEDMLLAVTHHPAMLHYLDNAESLGPNSVAGRRTGKGLNENLAREIMELHTLGVNGGYSQNDVTTFAKVLTGWSIGTPESGNIGGFFFNPNRHEPGTQTILGKNYADDGEGQGVAVLKDFAASPATAKHLATKLARHFISDNPPVTCIQKLADAFTRSGGNLTAMYRVLLGLPEAWSLATPKIKSSVDLVVSAARLMPPPTMLDYKWLLESVKFLGNVPFNAPSPAGYSDMARDQAGPEAVLRRIEWAQGAANKFGPQDVATLAMRAIGPLLNAKTSDVLNSAHDPREGLALLLGSPEFQRR